MKICKTTMLKPADVEREWWHVDGTDQIVGRLATRIALVLMGKHKPTYTPHIDTGDFVVVTNAEKVHFTGKKWDQKEYGHYTGYVGGRVTRSARKVHDDNPEEILYLAVKRMLPKNRLGRKMFKKLKIYAGPDHPHQAQTVRELDVSATKRA